MKYIRFKCKYISILDLNNGDRPSQFQLHTPLTHTHTLDRQTDRHTPLTDRHTQYIKFPFF